jgi:hypothetical protein
MIQAMRSGDEYGKAALALFFVFSGPEFARTETLGTSQTPFMYTPRIK